MRYSIRFALLVMVVVALISAYLAFPTPIERINAILASDANDSEKESKLRRYFKVGDLEVDIHRRLKSSPSVIMGGSVSHTEVYDGGLIISYRADGTAYEIGYNRNYGGSNCDFHLLSAVPLMQEEFNKPLTMPPR